MYLAFCGHCYYPVGGLFGEDEVRDFLGVFGSANEARDAIRRRQHEWGGDLWWEISFINPDLRVTLVERGESE